MAAFKRFVFYGPVNEPTALASGIRAKRVKILSISVPNSFYNIISGFNDTIKFNEGAGTLTASLTPGYYSTTTALLGEVKTALDAAGGQVYTVSYSSTTLFCTISAAGNFELEFSSNNEICSILGFDKSDTGLALSHTSTNAFQIVPFEAFYLRIKELGGGQYFTGSFSCGGIHAVIPISGEYTGASRFEKNERFEQELDISDKQLSILTPELSFLDSNHQLRAVDLHGLYIRIYFDWSEE